MYDFKISYAFIYVTEPYESLKVDKFALINEEDECEAAADMFGLTSKQDLTIRSFFCFIKNAFCRHSLINNTIISSICKKISHQLKPKS